MSAISYQEKKFGEFDFSQFHIPIFHLSGLGWVQQN